MDFALSEEQKEFRANALEFGRLHLSDGAGSDDRDHRFPVEKWSRLADWGLFGLCIPETSGGQGLDYLTSYMVFEALGEGCADAGLLFSAAVQHYSAALPLVGFGSEEQIERYLPSILDGTTIATFAVTEPDSGSDAFSMRTRAERGDGGWRLSGSKTFICNCGVADIVIVFARSGDPGAVGGGISAFIVDTRHAGVTWGNPFETMGLRSAPVGELFLDGVFVADDAVIGRRGVGMAIFNDVIAHERTFLPAIHLGAMQRELLHALGHAKERQAFGQSIGKFQSVQNRLVDTRLRIETARLLGYRAAWLVDQRKRQMPEASMAKLWTSEAMVQSSLDLLQVFGTSGYMTETGVERTVRDAVASRLYSGTSEIMRVVIARSMGL